jgi:aminoglycoside/choline kinase family phosphotransferase
MSDREQLKRDFLARAGLGGAQRTPLAGDASTRSYERLTTSDGKSLIFMDQPPAAETAPCPPDATREQRVAAGYNAMARLAAGSVDAFVACAAWLKGQGLSAPAIVAADPAAGLAVLEDLGDGLYAGLIAAGAADEGALYDAAIDALLALHAAPAPAVLEGGGSRWPLLAYDDLALATAHDLFIDWWDRLAPVTPFDDAARADWRALWAPARALGEAGASVFCHRDYHAENLIWLPEREGAARVGLLDFQDAVRAHPAWDLSMLLHDARRTVTPALEARALDRYLAARPDLEREAFLDAYAQLGALNVVRILGVFARLTVRDGKPRYATLTPRMWTYLDALMRRPALASLKAWMDRHAPEETRPNEAAA